MGRTPALGPGPSAGSSGVTIRLRSSANVSATAVDYQDVVLGRADAGRAAAAPLGSTPHIHPKSALADCAHQNQHECVRVTGVFQPASPAAPPWLSSPGPFFGKTVFGKYPRSFSGFTPL